MTAASRPFERRLVLHGGLPKTGTSAIQAALWRERGRLLQETGLFYPEPVAHPAEPRQTFLHTELSGGPDNLPTLRAALDQAEVAGARSMVFSTEGLFIQASMLDPARVSAFMKLAAARGWTPEILFVLREPEAWRRSLYRQFVVSPRLPHSPNPLERLYATGETYARFARKPEIARAAEPDALRKRFSALFPGAEITFMDYGPDIVARVFNHLGAVWREPETPADGRTNLMVPDAYLEVLRRINAQPVIGGRLNPAARAVLRGATGTRHIGLNITSGRPGRRSMRLLAQILPLLRWRPNPPLKVDVKTFAAARRAMSEEAARQRNFLK